MPSTAHAAWIGDQRSRIGELGVAHTSAASNGQATCQLLHSMFLRLAAEFQEYARFLHTLTGDVIVNECAPTNAGLAAILSNNFLAKRDLDSSNAKAESIANDFKRLGIPIWDALTTVHGKQVDAWKQTLSHLNTARNAIAHNDGEKFVNLRLSNVDLTLLTFDQWQKDLDDLVTAMDETAADYLSKMLSITRPW